MAKKDKDKKVQEFKLLSPDYDTVAAVTAKSKGDGKFKGSKKEKRLLKKICPHNRYVKNKSGKKRPKIVNDGHGNCYCKICGAKMPASFYKDSIVDKRAEGFQDIIVQHQLIAQSIGAPKKTVAEISNTAIMVDREAKLYKQHKKIAEKQDKVGKKGKKKKTNFDYSKSYGGWGYGK